MSSLARSNLGMLMFNLKILSHPRYLKLQLVMSSHNLRNKKIKSSQLRFNPRDQLEARVNLRSQKIMTSLLRFNPIDHLEARAHLRIKSQN